MHICVNLHIPSSVPGELICSDQRRQQIKEETTTLQITGVCNVDFFFL